jgi:ABC-type antimicrobial peptide transport system permease subunit
MINYLKHVFTESWVSSPSRTGLHILGFLWAISLTTILGSVDLIISKNTETMSVLVKPSLEIIGKMMISILTPVTFTAWVWFLFFWLYCFLFELKRNSDKYEQ